MHTRGYMRRVLPLLATSVVVGGLFWLFTGELRYNVYSTVNGSESLWFDEPISAFGKVLVSAGVGIGSALLLSLFFRICWRRDPAKPSRVGPASP